VEKIEEMAAELGLLSDSEPDFKGLNVVLGASSALGRAVIRALNDESRMIRRVVTQEPNGPRILEGAEVVYANPLVASEIADSLEGASVVFDCLEPYGLKWKQTLSEITSNVLLASIELGATLVVSSHPFRTVTDNATIENDVLEANSGGLARTVVARMPHTYGPGIVNEVWRNVFEAVVQGKKAHWVGNPNVPRSFLYVEDAAKSMILLSKTRSAFGKVWNVAGPGPLSGKELIDLSFRVSERSPDMAVWGRGVMLTGWLLASGAKDFLKLPYDFYDPFVFDGNEFTKAFPAWEYTPHEEGIRKTLAWFREFTNKSGSRNT
jgi:nucleoside-diphosphate-sugar epimerase